MVQLNYPTYSGGSRMNSPPPCTPVLISPTSHHLTFPDAGYPLWSSGHAQLTWPRWGKPGHLQPPALRRAPSPAPFPGPDGDARAGRPGRLRPEEVVHGSGAVGPPRVQPCGSGRSDTHLLGMAGRCSAPGPRGGSGLLAWLRHRKAAANGASGRAQRTLEGTPGRGGLGGRKAAEGQEGAPVRQLFRPSPEPARGLPLAWPGPPLPARCWLLSPL